MKKIYTIICGLLLGSAVMANDTESLGIITDKDFAQVGVPKENVIKAKEIIKNSKNRYDYLILDRRSKELEINKCIEELTDQIGKIEADILKERIKSQYEAQKYINQEQYLRAREIAIKRIESARENKNGNIKANPAKK